MSETMTLSRPCRRGASGPAGAEDLFLAALVGDADVKRHVDDELDRRAARRLVAAITREALEPCAA